MLNEDKNSINLEKIFDDSPKKSQKDMNKSNQFFGTNIAFNPSDEMGENSKIMLGRKKKKNRKKEVKQVEEVQADIIYMEENEDSEI